MGDKSKIEWTDATWNPITGCSHAGSPGCDNCYARRMAKRLAGRCGYPPAPKEFGVTFHENRIDQPCLWRKPRKIFVCSMSDLFHPRVYLEWIFKVYATITSPYYGCLSRKGHGAHKYQILTKRPSRINSTFESFGNCYGQDMLGSLISRTWFGATIENQEWLEKRTHHLLQTPAAVRFLSLEPLLGPVDLTAIPYNNLGSLHKMNALGGYGGWGDYDRQKYRIHWVIVGGETGPGARPMHPDWVRSIRDQCLAAEVPFFFKGWGQYIHESQAHETDIDPDDWNQCVDAMGFVRVKNKKTSGCLLDGKEWKEKPITGV